LVSQLVQVGLGVRVVLTDNAERFVGPATLEALSGRPVIRDTFDSNFPLGAHIQLARDADLLCISPATANFIAKAAHGLADDLLSTLYLCFQGTTLIAPAMNCEMWERSAVQRNVNQLRADGVQIIEPQAGWLSCRTEGIGRMAEPSDIAACILRTFDLQPDSKGN
jgi:phosphopantothenoylcysteine decarboxylase/phosphopantothenate--cysteine ligase